MKVAFPGPPGTSTAAAAASLHPGGTLLPVAGSRAVVYSVAQGDAQRGVLPIENSRGGPVSETHDLLHEWPVSIVAEAVLPLRHALLSRHRIGLDRVSVIHAHPDALDHCRGLLAFLSQASVVLAASSADAARNAARSEAIGDAAISTPEAAELHGLATLRTAIDDAPCFMRYVSVAAFTSLSERSEARTAFSFVTDHRPGALHAAITPLATAGVDLVRVVSRPVPHTPWSYRFDVVVVGHPLYAPVREALAELRNATSSHRVLGVYRSGEIDS